MKKILLIILCLSFFSVKLMAQREVIPYKTDFDNKKYYWGYYLGLNAKTFRVSYTDENEQIDVSAATGFNIGLIAGWNINKNVTLRTEPGLSSNTKTLAFTNVAGGTRDSIREVPSTYLHIPLLLKLNTDRIGNIRPYIIGGISYERNFKSNEDNANDNSEGEFRMKTSNFAYEVGVGMDIYLPYFVFSPSIRGTFMLNNEIVYDNDPNSQWTSNIDKFQTRGVFISLAFH